MASQIPLERDCFALYIVVIAAFAKYAFFGTRVSSMTRNLHALNLVPPRRDYIAVAILNFYEIVKVNPEEK
jgi:hypothetical protein